MGDTLTIPAPGNSAVSPQHRGWDFFRIRPFGVPNTVATPRNRTLPFFAATGSSDGLHLQPNFLAIMRTFVTTFLNRPAICLAALALTATVRAAPVTWSVPATIAGDGDVSTNGAGVFAYCYSSSPPVTLNGVSFTAEVAGGITWTSTDPASPNTYPDYAGASALSAAYKQVLYGSRYNNTTAPLTLTLNNLTAGHQYQVQVWVDDSRAQYNRNQNLTSSGGNTINLNYNTGTGTGTTGQFSIGTFTATTTTQAFTLTGNVLSQVNAIQLRDLSGMAAPMFTPPAGTYVGTQSVTIAAETGSTVYYTTNGTPPNNTSASGAAGSGTAAVNVPASQTLKAFAVKSGKADSAVATAAYLITLAKPAFNPPPGSCLGSQTVTLTGEPGTTIWFTTDGTMPGPASPHGAANAGSATVAVTAPSKLLVSAIATKPGIADSALATGYYRAVSGLTEAPVFSGPRREGANKDGVVKTRWGVEQTMMFEDGIFKSWYHGSPAPESPGDYWNSGAIRYATSPDGINWTDQGVCLGNSPYHRGCPYTYHLTSATAAGEPAGYYMPVGRNGQFGFDLFYSTTGLPGSWTWLNNSNLILSLGISGSWDGFRTGNICIWYEANQWQVMYEAGSGSGGWQVGRAYGPSLTSLVKYPGNPVIPYGGPGTAVGGTEVHKVGHTYYCIIHETDPSINWTPTSCSLYKSTDLNHWTRMGWLAREWVYKNNEAQVADGTLVSVNGKTWFWYEDVQYQNPQLPELSLMTWDMPFEELVQHPEMWDDVVAEGWAYDPGFGEVLSPPGTWPATYVRKIGSPIPPNCLVLKTDATHSLRLRKAVGLTNNRFAFSARADQTTVKFTPLRLDADSNNTVLAGAFFDTDGKIKYYQGAAIVTARSYVAGTTYAFAYECAPTGYTLSINGKRVAANIPYASASAAPAYFKIEQTAGGTGYVGTAQSSQSGVWSGAVNGTWDSTAANWLATGPPLNLYSEGDTVKFDDTAAGSGPVAVTITAANVAPGGILAANNLRDYSIGGNPITGSATLTKSGSARLQLTGSNTYTGSTTVTGGTLAVSGSLGGQSAITVGAGATLALGSAGCLNFAPLANGVVNTIGGSGTLVLDGSLTIDLAAASTTAGNSWLLVNANSLAATYGTTFKLTDFSMTGTGVWTCFRGPDKWSFRQASGLLAVEPASYGVWADTFAGLSDKSSGGDPDGDGIPNLIEYVIGGDPRAASAASLPKPSLRGGYLVLSYRRNDAAEADTTHVGQWSADLVHWTDIASVLVNENGPAPDDMEIRIPLAYAQNGRAAGRLKVTMP